VLNGILQDGHDPPGESKPCGPVQALGISANCRCDFGMADRMGAWLTDAIAHFVSRNCSPSRNREIAGGFSIKQRSGDFKTAIAFPRRAPAVVLIGFKLGSSTPTNALCLPRKPIAGRSQPKPLPRFAAVETLQRKQDLTSLTPKGRLIAAQPI
jgi:hypothetical protein